MPSRTLWHHCYERIVVIWSASPSSWLISVQGHGLIVIRMKIFLVVNATASIAKLSYKHPFNKVWSLQWRHNERDGVSNHQFLDCLLYRLFRQRSEKTSKLRIIGLCEGNSLVTGEFPSYISHFQRKPEHDKLSHEIKNSAKIPIF